MVTTLSATAPTFTNNAIQRVRQDVSARPAWFVLPSGLDWTMTLVGENHAGEAESVASRSLSRAPKIEALPTPISTFTPKTELGRRLWEIRRRIVASGTPLLTSEEIDREIAEGRRWQE